MKLLTGVFKMIKYFSYNKRILIGLTVIVSLLISAQISYLKAENPESAKTQQEISSVVLFQNNILAPLSLMPEPKINGRIRAVVTAYSSCPLQTDDSPNITAAGTHVKDGIIANNYYSFGTKIRIPQIFGDKVFIVEDRMHWRKSNSHFDIWFPEYWQAKNFGIQDTYIEILES